MTTYYLYVAYAVGIVILGAAAAMAVNYLAERRIEKKLFS